MNNSLGLNGTIYYFDAKISAVSTGIAQDAAVTYTVTAEISSVIGEIPAAAS